MLRWPAFVLILVAYLSQLLVLDISYTSPECVVEMTFVAKHVTSLLFPVVIILLTLIIGGVKYAMAGSDEEKQQLAKDKIVATVLLWLKLLYMSLVKTVLVPFSW